MNILVVCHGNIYRSPFAAKVIHHHSDVSVDVRSGGFVNPGHVAAKKMRLAAKEWGYDLSLHRSKLVTIKDLQWADITLYMDDGNYRRLLSLAGSDLHEMTLTPLGEYAVPPVKTIKDPAFTKAGSDEFRSIVDTLENAARNFANSITKHYDN